MKRLFTGLAGLFKSKPSPARTAPREVPAPDRFLPRTPSRANIRRLLKRGRIVLVGGEYLRTSPSSRKAHVRISARS